MWSNNNYLVAAITITAAVATSVAYFVLTRRKQWRRVGTVSKLYVYPLKSSRGLDVREASFISCGIGLCKTKDSIDRLVVYLQTFLNLIRVKATYHLP